MGSENLFGVKKTKREITLVASFSYAPTSLVHQIGGKRNEVTCSSGSLCCNLPLIVSRGRIFCETIYFMVYS